MPNQKYFGPPCPHYPERYKTEVAHEAHDLHRWMREKNLREAKPRREFESDGYPLRLRLQRLLAAIKQRCGRGKYKERGITTDLTFEDLAFLWARDSADTLRRPSIDRIDNDGPYTRSNCRFIEFADNIRRGVKVRDGSRIPQPDKAVA